MSVSKPALFQPVQVGKLSLKHRVVLAPLTRVRSTLAHVPFNPMMKEYYGQRASTPGTLLITEATFIRAEAGGYTNVPGIWNDEQVRAWKEITDEVHSKGSFIFCQLWALGRAAMSSVLKDENPAFPYVSSSDVPLKERPETDPAPRPLTKEEIAEYVEWYGTAAENAIRAGFDGVEIHGANGYLIDQFLQDVVNKRTDGYGGSIENRCRFPLEVVRRIVEGVGAERTGIRLSPWSLFQDMLMDDPIPTFSHFISKLAEIHSEMAYIHVVESRVLGNTTVDNIGHKHASNDFVRDLWFPRPLITAGGYSRQSALEVAEKGAVRGGKELIAFGRDFLANPDLPIRLEKNIPLNAYNRATFYLNGETTGLGYTDYPFAT